MKTISRYFLILTLALAGLSSAGALSLDEAFSRLKTYKAGEKDAVLHFIAQEVARLSRDSVQRAQLAERLAALAVDPALSYDARLFVCKQLRLVASEKQVPALTRLLLEPETSDMARLVLQPMPGAAASRALIGALDHLEGKPLIGVIHSLAERREAQAVARLGKLLARTTTVDVKRAVLRGLGRIGTIEAARLLASVRPEPALREILVDAELACAQRLQQNGHVREAVGIYERYFDRAQSLRVRMAALTGWVQADKTSATPHVLEALQAREQPLAHLAIEQARGIRTSQVTAALRKAVEGARSETRYLLLGALAERGDTDALAELKRLAAAGSDRDVRRAALHELRRLTWVTRDAAILEQVAATIAQPEIAVETLTPSPYPALVIASRRKAVAKALPKGTTLLAYLDCGVEAEGKQGDIVIRQRNGKGWVWPGSTRVAPGPLGTVAFDGARVEFEISGLDPAKHYLLGFTWWDYDSNGRAQSITLVSGDRKQRVEVVPTTKLPGYTKGRQQPAQFLVPIPAALVTKGKLRVIVRREAASNAVISEVWVAESSTEQQQVLQSVVGTANEVQPVAKKNAVDLTPPKQGTKVLIVTGIDYPGHHWRETAPVLKSLLEQDPRLKVRIVEDPGVLASPKLHEWDVVVLHFMNWEKPGPGREARENLQRFVASGKGMAMTHFACGAWHKEWPEFVKLAGRVWFGSEGGRQHDPRGKFTVEIADPSHPIVQGMQNFETDDELYTCLEGDTPIHVIAKARSKVDKKYYPMAFVLEYGKGRVFHTVLGHDVRAYTFNPAVGELLRRGVAWAAGLPPVPAEPARAR